MLANTRITLALARTQPRLLSGSRAQRRTVMTLRDHKYTAHATARGQGRNGEVISDDDNGLTLRLAMPRSLGGNGDGQNPEQLFAMGYAACFLSALQLTAGKKGNAKAVKDASVHAQVHIGQPEDGEGFGLAVELQIEGVDDKQLIDDAHKVCPYSRALMQGADIKVSQGGPKAAGSEAGRKNIGSSVSDPAEGQAKSRAGQQSPGQGVRGYS